MIVYSNWSSGPLPSDEAEVRKQLFAASRYRNKLTEIERRRIAAREAAQTEFSPELRAAEEQRMATSEEVKRLNGALKGKKAAARKAVRPSAEERAALDAAKAAEKEAKEKCKLLKATLKDNEPYKERLKEIDQIAYQESKDATHQSKEDGVFWTTVDSMWAASEDSKKKYRASVAAYFASNGSVKYPNPPRFNSFDGSGKLSVRGPQDGQLQMIKMEHAEWFEMRGHAVPIPPTPGSRRSEYQRIAARIRVGSSGPGNKIPLWVTVPVLLHRPLPEGAVIKAAWLIREKVGTHFQHRFQFRVDVPQRPLPAAPGGVLAMNFGWRTLDSGRVRAAYWTDDSGAQGEILVPERTVSQIRKADELKGLLDDKFNAIKEIFGAWLKVNKMPAWMKEWWEARKAGPISIWRKRGRLAALVVMWRDKRFKGDESIFAALEEWRKKDKHLTDWEMNARAKAVRIRTEFYRETAAKLASTYQKVVLDSYNVAALLRKPAPADGTDAEGTRIRWMGRVAATASLRVAVVSAVLRASGQVFKPVVDFPTPRCHLCPPSRADLEVWNRSAQLEHRCSKCGGTWDQDFNACRNYMLAFERGSVELASSEQSPEES